MIKLIGRALDYVACLAIGAVKIGIDLPLVSRRTSTAASVIPSATMIGRSSSDAVSPFPFSSS